MNDAEVLAHRMSQLTSVRTETGVFVRMEGRFAVVNIGSSSVTIPCVGFYPPVAGMPVRVDWVNGAPAVTGPVRPLNPLGAITATGNPRATVTVDGVEYSLFYRAGYTPEVGDPVEVNWATGIIQGKITGAESPETPGESGGGGVPFDVTVRAQNSSRHQSGSGWWGNDPWASSSNKGIWVYGSTIADAVGGGTVTAAYVFLPLIAQVGVASIGVHDYPSIPGGAPSLLPSSLMPMPLGGRSGWIALSASVGQYLAAGGRGLGVLAPGGGGYTRWRGTASDGMSGAVRLVGIR